MTIEIQDNLILIHLKDVDHHLNKVLTIIDCCIMSIFILF